jgi:RING finger protein 113A
VACWGPVCSGMTPAVDDLAGQTNDDTGIYRGQAFYKNYMPKDPAQIGANKYTGTQGPIRATAYMRSTAVIDYKPDICKDYKETGYCGYGDSCKFIHDRGDYKTSYELEAEWEQEQKRRRLR